MLLLATKRYYHILLAVPLKGKQSSGSQIHSRLIALVLQKVIHSKYYKHLKKGAHQSYLGRQKWAGFWRINLYMK